jgi:asparagine synthase (glutamine-hydrolysing)
MAGIVGAYKSQLQEPEKRLSVLSHRGNENKGIITIDDFTIGVTSKRDDNIFKKGNALTVIDGNIYNGKGEHGTAAEAAHGMLTSGKGDDRIKNFNGEFSFVSYSGGDMLIARDPLGAKPLYYIQAGEGMVFASEAKAIADLPGKMQEFPPGHYCTPEGFHRYFSLTSTKEVTDENVAIERVKELLERAVLKRLGADTGSWLSGGIDSSIIAAIANKYQNIHTFFIGTKDSTDLKYARIAAEHLGTRHHEKIVGKDEIIKSLPEAIFHLESFDTYLVRSSVLNYLVGKLASEHVSSSLTGEGGDELFGGYTYLSDVSDLDMELVKIANALHDTAFQRVDRMSSAHGLEARIPFSDVELVNYVFSVPAEIKVFNTGEHGKWLLKQAAMDYLPEEIVQRPKIKFWQGGGIEGLLQEYAEESMSDSEFESTTRTNPEFQIRNKEEALYFSILKERFPNLDFVKDIGRTENP